MWMPKKISVQAGSLLQVCEEKNVREHETQAGKKNHCVPLSLERCCRLAAGGERAREKRDPPASKPNVFTKAYEQGDSICIAQSRAERYYFLDLAKSYTDYLTSDVSR